MGDQTSALPVKGALLEEQAQQKGCRRLPIDLR
jgi:hypothetical protein